MNIRAFARRTHCLIGLALLAMANNHVTFAAASETDRVQGRSMVVSRSGIVAAEHPLASQAGAMVLAEGGTAVDAAIAANAVMGVVAPMTCGMGGDLFAIVRDARTGEIHGLNSSGWAPAALTREFLASQGLTNMPFRTIHSVTVPGCLAGWDALKR
jgi:gamma-glutamyltranspeptidase/glutathione hydrolase